jgi:hypothetical protein
MLQALELLATFAATLFAGAALYINVAEHAARMEMETSVAVLQWAPSYKRATWLQAPLASISFFAAMTRWLLGAGIGWLAGALLIGSVIPFTFAAVMPTNHKLLAASRDLSSAETRILLITWGRLHAVRTALSLIAAVVFFWLLGEA